MNSKFTFFSAEMISAHAVSTARRLEMSDWMNLVLELGFRELISDIMFCAWVWERPIR